MSKNWESIKSKFEPEVLGLAMEYRNIANAYLSHRKIKNISEISLSPIADVNHMLIGDKIQNYKDFLIYHHGTHDRTEELDQYFKNWLKKLEVSESTFETIYGQLKAIELFSMNSKIENKENLTALSELTGFDVKSCESPSSIELKSVGFRRSGMTHADFKFLTPINKICDTIVSKAMNTNYRTFDDFLTATIHTQLKAITKNDIFEKICCISIKRRLC